MEPSTTCVADLATTASTEGGGNDQYNIYDNNWGVDRISGDSGGAEDWLIFQISSGVLTIDLTPTSGQPEVSSGANRINFASDVVIE